jgi:hypothetical protein
MRTERNRLGRAVQGAKVTSAPSADVICLADALADLLAQLLLDGRLDQRWEPGGWLIPYPSTLSPCKRAPPCQGRRSNYRSRRWHRRPRHTLV